jgi:cytochrome b involved in lipid metabolism
MTTSRVSSPSCQVLQSACGGADKLPTTRIEKEAAVEDSSIPTKAATTKTTKIKIMLPNQKEKWWWMTKFPLPILSCIWLALCTGLVLKYPKLLSVFFAFVACWVVRWTAGRGQGRRAAPHFLATGAAGVALWWDGQVANALSIIAGYLAYCHWSSSYDVVVVSASKPTSTTSTMARVTHDAITLTVAVVLLVVYYDADNDDNDESTTATGWPSSVASTTSLWLVTHWVRLLLLWNNNNNDDDDATTNDNCDNNSGDINISKQIPAAITATSITVQVHQQPPISSTSTSSSSSSHATNMIWRIHGQEYDLSSYVQYHPGGYEAILLGANRPDCTALFESYHPFTKTTARTVLQKYRINNVRLSSSSVTTTSGSDSTMNQPQQQQQQQQQTKQLPNNNTTNNQNMHKYKADDPFYAELCRAVAATLRQHGLDPVRDRAASRSITVSSRWASSIRPTIISRYVFFFFLVCSFVVVALVWRSDLNVKLRAPSCNALYREVSWAVSPSPFSAGCWVVWDMTRDIFVPVGRRCSTTSAY